MSETNGANREPKYGLGDLTWNAIDASFENHGSVVIVRPLSQAAKDWLAEYVDQDGFQPYRDAVVVEPRFVDDLLTGMQKDGLHISV